MVYLRFNITPILGRKNQLYFPKGYLKFCRIVRRSLRLLVKIYERVLDIDKLVMKTSIEIQLVDCMHNKRILSPQGWTTRELDTTHLKSKLLGDLNY